MQSPGFLFGRKEKENKQSPDPKLKIEKSPKEEEKDKKDKEKKDKKDKKKSKEEEEKIKKEKKEQELLLAKESKSKKEKDNKDKKEKDKDKKDKKSKEDKDKNKDSKKDKKGKKSTDSNKDSSLVSDKDRSLTQESSFESSTVTSSPEKGDTSAEGSLPEGSPLPGYTKPYDYLEDSSSPNKSKLVGAFSYEGRDKMESPKEELLTPTGRKATGLAFNYAPGEAQRVAETAAEKKKHLLEKSGSGNEADAVSAALRTPGLDYVESAARKEQAKIGADLSPAAKRALDMKGGGIFRSGKDAKSSDDSKSGAQGLRGLESLTTKSAGSTFGAKDPKTGATVVSHYDEGLAGGAFPYGAGSESPKGIQDINRDFLSAERGSVDQLSDGKGGSLLASGGPKIVKTTTKQSMVKDREGVTQNIEEKVEDLLSGEVTVSTQVNKVSYRFQCLVY